MCISIRKEGVKMEPCSFQWCPATGPEEMKTESQEAVSAHQEMLLLLGGKTSTGASCPERLRSLHGPGQPA